jgi:pimeloyl-ACP methyl ester carboxylesterase
MNEIAERSLPLFLIMRCTEEDFMTRICPALMPFIIMLLIAVFIFNCKSQDKSAPFSFDEIRSGPSALLDRPEFVKASDGIDLAYYTKIPKSKPAAALIFLHGGGAYSGAGYQNLAEGLMEKYGISVYLIDLRGHGNSGGPRGDSPSVQQVWEDLKLFVNYVGEKNPGIPLYLGGHSSGGGLVLNYLTWDKKTKVDGYFFISPQFGYKSATARENTRSSFTTVRYWVFILSAISGGRLFGHTTAVYFNYPEKILASQPLMLQSITRHMSVSITPDAPQKQFSKIDKPFGLFIGEKDELFAPEKIVKYSDYSDKEIQMKSVSKIVENENHLSILLIAHELIGKTMMNWRNGQTL